jgi:DNA-binding NarL/FixJ family response regulator
VLQVLVADKHQVVREGIALEIARHSDIELVGKASDGYEVIELANYMTPDVVILDIVLPGLSGVQVIQHLLHPDGVSGRGLARPPAVLVFSAYGDRHFVWSALAAGARGYLLKNEPPSLVIEGVRALAAGEAMLSRSVQTLLVSLVPSLHRELTPRETEVLNLLARGMSDDDIAAKLNIKESTVRNHLSNAYRKVPLIRTRAEAVTWTRINQPTVE